MESKNREIVALTEELKKLEYNVQKENEAIDLKPKFIYMMISAKYLVHMTNQTKNSTYCTKRNYKTLYIRPNLEQGLFSAPVQAADSKPSRP